MANYYDMKESNKPDCVIALLEKHKLQILIITGDGALRNECR